MEDTEFYYLLEFL